MTVSVKSKGLKEKVENKVIPVDPVLDIEDRIKKFVGAEDNCIAQIKQVSKNNYRINLYRRDYIGESVIPKTTMSASYYLEVDGSVIKDLTIR